MKNSIRKTIAGILGLAMTSMVVFAQTGINNFSDKEISEQKELSVLAEKYSGENVDWKEYISDVKALALKNNTEAMRVLADFYKRGIEKGDESLLEKNEAEAERLLQRAASLGNKQARLQIEAEEYMKVKVDVDNERITGKDIIEKLNSLVEKNNSVAMLGLSAIYSEGKIVEKNKNKAKELLQKAATLGNPDAIKLLEFDKDIFQKHFNSEAEAYVKVINELKKENMADLPAKLNELVEKDNNTSAMMGLSTMYLQGKQVEKNTKKANELALKAAAMGNTDAIKLVVASSISRFESELRECLEIENAEKNSNALIVKLNDLVKKNNTAAMLRLAYIYQKGEIVESNKEKAQSLVDAAVKQGNIVAIAIRFNTFSLDSLQ